MTRTDRAGLLVHVDAAQAFAALTEEAALLRWLPPAGMRGHFDRFDLREGGSYRLVLTYDDAADAPGKSSADSDVVEVAVVALVPGERLVVRAEFDSDDPSFAGTMDMEWSVTPDADGAVVEFEARNVPVGIKARDHAAGMTSSLANLAAYLEP